MYGILSRYIEEYRIVPKFKYQLDINKYMYKINDHINKQFFKIIDYI